MTTLIGLSERHTPLPPRLYNRGTAIRFSIYQLPSFGAL